ncbi:sodium/hydrogen exchanger 9B2-like [Clavelina lepadiformis]|uniref:sodium/hydrogen exchanger 9B2-like n=1 Tax=Clavelina lepadiformis TaxID=159417 RepID=UPI0040433AB9
MDEGSEVHASYLHDDTSYVVSREPSISAISGNTSDDDGSHHHHEERPAHYYYHMNKGSQHGEKEPVDLDKGHNEEPGCGCNPTSFWGKCAIFWGNQCGCESTEKFVIGFKRVGGRVFICILFWAFFWSITALGGGYSLPGGSLFGIIMVFLFGIVGETLIVLIPMPYDLPNLPPLLASLFIGIFLRNVPVVNVAKYIDPDWAFTLRQMALGIILGEAGVEVDKEMMRKLKTVVPRLSFSPCLTEAIAWGVFSHLILGLPWLWSFMLGFVCGAVAPACVVPSMIKFQAAGLGVAHGVPTLLMAAASIDDIIAINGFNIILTVTFSTGGIGFDLLNALFEVLFGLAFGIVCGILMWIFPDPRQHNVVRDRTVLLIGTSWFLIFMTNIIDVPGSGTLGTLTCSFVASLGWPEDQMEAVGKHYKALWFLFQPLLFGLTGANVDLSLMSGETVGLTVACMLICLFIRLTVAGNAVSFLGWTHKEKFLTAISWIPKATVQAAIGGTALQSTQSLCGPADKKWPPLCNDTSTAAPNDTLSATMAPKTTTVPSSNVTQTTTPPSCLTEYGYPSPKLCENYYSYATTILQVSVIVIIFTAPIGVFLIGLAGPRLLTVGAPPDEEEGKEKKSSEKIEMENVNEMHEYDNPDFQVDGLEGVTPPPMYSEESLVKTRM